MNLPESGIPKTLYKYRVWNKDSHKKILKNFQIYLSPPSSFNDPFDCAIPLRYDKLSQEELFNKFCNVVKLDKPQLQNKEIIDIVNKRLLSLTNEQLIKFGEDGVKDLDKVLGVISLSQENDNILLWSHYSECHTGFCIGLDTKLLAESIGGTIGPVIYQELYPVIKPSNNGPMDMIQQVMTKSSHWSYEKEYRIAKMSPGNRIFTLKPEVIKEVIFGLKMKEEDKQEIKKVLNEKLPHVKVFQADQNKEKFIVDILPK